MATLVNLPAIQKGDTIPYKFTWADSLGDPINMQSKTILMAFKAAAVMDDLDADLVKTVVIAANNADALLGIVEFRLERSETALLTGGMTYAYSLRVVEAGDPEPVETTFTYGSIEVKDA